MSAVSHGTAGVGLILAEGLGFNAVSRLGCGIAAPLTPSFDITRTIEMKSAAAVEALTGLANEHRLAVYRLLVQAGPQGRSAGAIADKLDMAASSLSFHLAHLTRTGLIQQRREGRSLIYSADFDVMSGLVGFLTENCCGGASCAPAAASRRKAS